jgi:DNA-binding CsgD family transcriptional regulator
MAALFDKPILCPILVGRAPYLDSLEQRLQRVRDGQGQTLLLAGEAGIGKSRLVAEAKSVATQQSFTLLQGNCFEPDRGLPYAPVLDLLRTFIARHSLEPLRPFTSELVKLLPELGPLLPDTVPTPPLAPEQEKRRHFQTLTRFLLQGGDRPGTTLLVIVEDLHWCDDTSLEFLLYFARQIAAQPVWLLLTYRHDEAQTHPALRHFLADLDRERLASELLLQPLPQAGVEAMIRAIFEQPHPVRPEFAEAIHSLTDGNPFFVEETLKSLVASGDIYFSLGGWTRKPVSELRIPRTVQDAVSRRTEQLSPAARALLTLAAVAGRRFDVFLLQHVTQQTEEELLRLVKELIAAQLVVEESADQFVFRHALTRQAVYASLLARERRALHRQLLEAMERLYTATAEAHLAELAYHAYESQAWEIALTYSRRAGEKAQALYTPRAALEHFTRALEAARQLALASQTPDLASLYRARGQMYQTLGELEAARADYEAMLDEARAHADRPAEWQALIDLGFLWAAQDYERTGEYFRRALEAARGLGDPARLGHSLNRIGNWRLNVEQVEAARRCHLEALGLFEALDDKPGLAATLDLLGITSLVLSDLIQSVAYYERAMALFRELNDRGGLLSSLLIYAGRGANYLSSTAVTLRTPVGEQVRDADRALLIAREIDARPAEAMGLIWLGLILSSAGEYGRALEGIRKGLEIAEAIEHRHFMAVGHMILGALYVDLLALPIARGHLEQALTLARETGSHVWMGTISAFLATACTRQGDLSSAEALLRQRLTPDLPMQTMAQRQLWTARAELALAQNDPAEALRLVEQLIAAAPNIETAGEHAIPRLGWLRGEALTALGRMKEAEAVLQAAQSMGHELGLTPMLWRLSVALGKTYLAWGRRDEAASAFASARTIIEDLAAKLAEADTALRDNFLRSALASMARVSLDSPRRKAKEAAGGLTNREREVAALIAQGKTNREIAGAMVLSHRTVEAHISNILSKLNLASRAQIAVWAVERGLTQVKAHPKPRSAKLK